MSSRAWSSSDPDPAVVDPRPGAVLTAAAAVPLGVAVLMAAGLLPWGARVVVGLAVVVLGVRIRSLPGTVLGSRVGPATVRGIGLAVLVGGGLLATGALAVGLDGGSLVPDGFGDGASSYAGVFSNFGLSALPASLFGLQVAAAGAALAWWAGEDPRARAVGEVAAGAGAAVLAIGITADGALGLGGSARVVLLAVVAAVAAGLWVRADPDARWWRAAGIGSGVLLALQFSDAAEIVDVVSGGVVAPAVQNGSEAAGAVALAIGLASAAALTVLAVLRRDALVGVLPVGVLLLSRSVDHGVGQVGALVVPVLVTVAAAATVAGVGPLARRLDRPTGVAFLGLAVLVLTVALDQALADSAAGLTTVDGTDATDTGRVVSAVLAVLAFGGLTVLAHVVRGRAGQALALGTLLLVVAVSPLGRLPEVDPGSGIAKEGVVTVLLVLELLVAASVLRRHRPPLVLAAVGLLLVASVGRIASTLVLDFDDVDGALFAAASLGLPLVALVVAATTALAGPVRLVRGAQAVAGGLAFGAAVNAASVQQVLGETSDDGRSVAAEGLQAVVPVLLVLLLALGLALLAASAARRWSPPAAVAVAFGTGVLGGFLAAVAGTLTGGSREAFPIGVGMLGSAFGFDALASRAGDASGVWPVLFALLGAALLAAAWWLESRRPLPADAPLG